MSTFPILEPRVNRVAPLSRSSSAPTPSVRAPGGLFPPALTALLSGVSLWLAYFPAALGPVAFVALVPFLSLVRSRSRPWALYLSAWLGGVAFCLLATSWLSAAHPYMIVVWIAAG